MRMVKFDNRKLKGISLKTEEGMTFRHVKVSCNCGWSMIVKHDEMPKKGLEKQAQAEARAHAYWMHGIDTAIQLGNERS